MGKANPPKLRIRVIINPAAGQDVPVLATLNSVFAPASVDWDVAITHQWGDALRHARQAIADGCHRVAVYGGDGTVAEAAGGLLESEIPLAILPGGTANIAAQEMGVPTDLTAACELACSRNVKTRHIDVGQINDRHFLLRAGIGAEARITEESDRAAKDRWGYLAYLWSAVKHVTHPPMTTYHLTIDGDTVEVEGITCGIANSGTLGVAGIRVSPAISMDDGYLDVMVVQNIGWPTLVKMVGTMTGIEPAGSDVTPSMSDLQSAFRRSIQFWRGKEITVVSRPARLVQFDGELLNLPDDAKDVVHCRVLPKALAVLVPKGG